MGDGATRVRTFLEVDISCELDIGVGIGEKRPRCYTIALQRLIDATMNRTLCVAPMMGCTDRHCRLLFRLLSPNSMLYSEMLTTGAILYGPGDFLLAHAGDEPVAFQLGGSDPEQLAESAHRVELAGYQEVNLNCGCPSDRVQQGGIGACLMSQPKLVADCYRAMADRVDIPVTIKSRIGIDDQDSFEFFAGFIGEIHDAGCRHFQVHARAALLSGLSPKENREIPPLRYEYVTRIKEMFPDAEFILNGGITTVEAALDLLKTADGIMLGRAPYSNPFLLAELDYAIFGSKLADRFHVFSLYRDYVVTELAAGTDLKHMAKHLFGLFTGFPGARAFRRHLSNHMHTDGAGIEVLDDAVAFIQGTPLEHA